MSLVLLLWNEGLLSLEERNKMESSASGRALPHHREPFDWLTRPPLNLITTTAKHSLSVSLSRRLLHHHPLHARRLLHSSVKVQLLNYPFLLTNFSVLSLPIQICYVCMLTLSEFLSNLVTLSNSIDKKGEKIINLTWLGKF